MQTLICTQPGHFEYKEAAMPSLQKGHAIIKIKRVGVCGTDLHAYEGTQPYFTYPRILGHELSAELVDADNADDFKPGEAVTMIPYFNCGHCIACINGKPNCCVTMKVCGVHTDGGMAEYISVPFSSLVHSNGLSFNELALIEPLAIGAHAIYRANLQQDEFVLVIGAGPIGLGIIECAKIAGAKVIAMDVNSQRLSFCEKNVKPGFIINAANEKATEKLLQITNGNMPSVVIDATGNLNAIKTAFQYMSHGAKYILVGLQKGDITFSHPEFHKREATLMSSRNATRADFNHVINSIKNGIINPNTYITHRTGFAKVKDEFASWLDPGTGVMKAMIEMY